MLNNVFDYIPDDIINLYIFPIVDNKIKMLLCKEYYYLYHNIYYNFSYKYLIYIIKNNITICIDLLSNYKTFDITKREKITYNKKVFFSLFDLCIYLSKRYNNIHYQEYFTNLYKNQILSNFSNIRIKQYRNFIDKNILWTK
tara:strand:- start:186 stop:611 length:426 start_codon:yes stop_codon:yes gene_type:complete